MSYLVIPVHGLEVGERGRTHLAVVDVSIGISGAELQRQRYVREGLLLIAAGGRCVGLLASDVDFSDDRCAGGVDSDV